MVTVVKGFNNGLAISSLNFWWKETNISRNFIDEAQGFCLFTDFIYILH